MTIVRLFHDIVEVCKPDLPRVGCDSFFLWMDGSRFRTSTRIRDFSRKPIKTVCYPLFSLSGFDHKPNKRKEEQKRTKGREIDLPKVFCPVWSFVRLGLLPNLSISSLVIWHSVFWSFVQSPLQVFYLRMCSDRKVFR